MQSGIVSLIRGIVRLRVRGDHAETLLNRLVDEHMFVWNVSRLGDELEFDLHLSDFFRLRPLLRETGCRMRVVARFGMPFWLARLEKRKMLAAGALVFVTGLYLLSSFVWSVEIVGNKRISDSEIRRAAEQSGIHPWAWKFRLPQMDELSSRLARLLPDAAWVGVSVQGTRVRIEIVENTLPERRELMNPRHLVSTSDAVVTEIFAERGKPVVRRNTRVKKGDILISGIIGDEEMKQVVVAKGEVRGLVWHEYEIRVPLTQNRKVYTGNEHEKFYLVFGNRALQITGYGKSGYAQEVTLAERSMLRWRNVSLPIGWMTEHTKEVRTEEFQIGAEIAKQIGLAQARADILARFGTDARIHSENILHENMDNGKVYMKVLYEVEHIISTERPIVYTDMEDLETKHNKKE